MIVTLVFQLQLYSSLEFPFPQLTVFVLQKVRIFTLLYMHVWWHVRGSMCVGTCMFVCVSYATRRLFQLWFPFSFPFLFLKNYFSF